MTHVVELKKRPLISDDDKQLIIDALENLKEQIANNELIQIAYVGFQSDGAMVFGYCGADLEPYRLAGALQAQSQTLLHVYHVADQIDDS